MKLLEVVGLYLKRPAIKLSTGEPGGHNYLKPELIGKLCSYLDGTIVECCTAYKGKRSDPKSHWKVFNDHGFMKIKNLSGEFIHCDLLDEESELELPIYNGIRIERNIVGGHLNRYNSMLVLSHFKGHLMASFGGAIKNMSIGLASSKGKLNIHNAGDLGADMMKIKPVLFQESMADDANSIIRYFGQRNLFYVNIANNLSIDCDCDSNPAKPEMGDIGIFASSDPVAVDKACVDAVYNSNDKGKSSLIKRFEEKNGIHTLEASEMLGVGSMSYKLVKVD